MGARRTGAWRIAAAMAGAAVALSVVGLMVASASQLTVSSGHLFLQDAARCTNATIATTGFRYSGTGNWNRVRLVGVPDACAGLPIQLTVYQTTTSHGITTTTPLATGTGTAASGTVDVTVAPNYTSGSGMGVALLIGGWGVPTTWTPGGTVVSLRSFQTGEYVTAADRNSPLIANSTTNGTAQQFDLTINDDGSVSLHAYGSSRYVTVDGTTSQLIASSRNITGTPQKFYLITNPDGTIGLQSLANNMYVCADLNIATPPPLLANRTWILQWEEFYLIID